MENYKCPRCGYIYSPKKGQPDKGIKAGTAFQDLPAHWTCPECGEVKQSWPPWVKLDSYKPSSD